ncbi:hypothetical protein GE09DRAFT_1259742 [Coniochaeta sp. 2T2.1]|nr:hypothetical protein GE09DRAFT_1259742 [Coniochaeta sp. 2T2.1]
MVCRHWLSFGFVVATQLLAILAHPATNRKGNNGTTTTKTSAAAASSTAVAPAEEEGNANEVELIGQFDTQIDLGGGNIKTDILFPANGLLEVEFQNQDARVLTVTENITPAAAPPGFTTLEAVSYVVALEGVGEGLTLSKIDYIRNANSILGILCKETNTFAIVAETEFEAEEFELTAPVTNLAGEFAFFLPTATTATTGNGAATGGGTTNGATTTDVLQ